MLTTMLLQPRKVLLSFTAFVAVFLIFIHSTPSPYRLPVSSPTGGSAGKDGAGLEFIEPDDGRFHWSKVTQRYPVESFIPLPTGSTKIPKIQFDFPPEEEEARINRLSHLEEIKGEFLHAWKGYKEHAWLKDEVAPISGGTRDTFGGWAATLVDSLDTLWIMDLKDEFEEAVRAIDAIDFTTCSLGELNVFETTIRYLGGLLAAYDLSNGQYPTLLQKAWELGHMLYVAFDTPNRMPVLRWNSKDAAGGKVQEASDNALSAEIGSLTLEFTRLAQITGDARFFDAVQRIMDIFEAQQNSTKLPGMWPIVVNAKTLDFTAWNLFTIGGMADSLYEYLPKQHALLGGATEQYRNLFEGTARVMREHMFYRPMTSGEENILVPGDIIADDSGVHLDPKNQHLTCFTGGMFGLAGKMFDNPEDVDIGRRLTEGCLWAYEASPNGIMPEIMYTKPCEAESLCSWNEEQWFKEVQEKHSENGEAADARALVEQEHLGEGVTKVGDARYILRPEAIESVFILYRITGDETLRERAWKMFQQIIRFTKTPIAHAGLDNCVVEDPPKSDRMESFWTAETLKYFYLLFSHPASVSLDDYVLNTEAHPLRRPQ